MEQGSPTAKSSQDQRDTLKGCRILAFHLVQSLSRVQFFVTPWIAARQASLSITNSWSLLKLMSIEPVLILCLILCHPLLLPSIFPSIRVFSNKSVLCIRWPKYWSMDLTEAEGIKKRWQECTEELYKKDLHDPENHDGVITHLEPDILECEVKWALESITMN